MKSFRPEPLCGPGRKRFSPGFAAEIIRRERQKYGEIREEL